MDDELSEVKSSPTDSGEKVKKGGRSKRNTGNKKAEKEIEVTQLVQEEQDEEMNTELSEVKRSDCGEKVKRSGRSKRNASNKEAENAPPVQEEESETSEGKQNQHLEISGIDAEGNSASVVADSNNNNTVLKNEGIDKWCVKETIGKADVDEALSLRSKQQKGRKTNRHKNREPEVMMTQADMVSLNDQYKEVVALA
jgi:hypothetical protein